MAPLICCFTMLMLFTVMSLKICQQKRHHSGPFYSILFNSIEAQRVKDVLEKHCDPATDLTHSNTHTAAERRRERGDGVLLGTRERSFSVWVCPRSCCWTLLQRYCSKTPAGVRADWWESYSSLPFLWLLPGAHRLCSCLFELSWEYIFITRISF